VKPEPQRPRRLYLDTSAYLCVLLAEEGAGRLSDETAGAELLSSVLLVLEARRNLIRLAREGTLRPDQYTIFMERVEQDTELFLLRDLAPRRTIEHEARRLPIAGVDHLGVVRGHQRRARMPVTSAPGGGGPSQTGRPSSWAASFCETSIVTKRSIGSAA
jgi:hypothetical protein